MFIWPKATPGFTQAQLSIIYFVLLLGFVVVAAVCFPSQGLYNIGCPETHAVDQVGLELTEIHLPLPPKCWD